MLNFIFWYLGVGAVVGSLQVLWQIERNRDVDMRTTWEAEIIIFGLSLLLWPFLVIQYLFS